MSILSRLFGGGSPDTPKKSKGAEPEDYKGFRIFAEPMREGSSYRLAARIELDTDAGLKQHHLIRADTFGSMDEAVEISTAKAKQLIDQLGERLFN